VRVRNRRGGCHGGGNGGRLEGALGRGMCALERMNCRWPELGHRYGRRFYERLVSEEAELARIQPGDRVLHVGCGAYPSTAMALGRLGCAVVGIDRDDEAVAAARKVVAHEGLGSLVAIEHGAGETVGCSGYEAVWVSLHVHPKAQVLASCMGSLKEGGRLVFRDVAGPLRFVYRWAFAAQGDLRAHVHSARSRARRSLVTFVAEKCGSNSTPRLALSTLAAGRHGIVASTGSGHPLLEPLGIRPGRRICVRCLQTLGGSIVADLEGRRVAIDRHLAGEILVEPALSDPAP